MRVIAEVVLKQFAAVHPAARLPLAAWLAEVRQAAWTGPNEIKVQFRSASILKNNRVVFNIVGNKYRLVVAVLYPMQLVLIKFVGTHDDYDQVDVDTIEVNRGGSRGN